MTWLKQIDQNAKQDITKILVANKLDVANQEVTEEEGRALAAQHKMEFYRTSAKSGENVESMFEDITRLVINKQQLKKESEKK